MVEPPPEVVTVRDAIRLFPVEPPIVNFTDFALPVHVPLEYVLTLVVIAFEPSELPNPRTILVMVASELTVKYPPP